MVPGFAYALVSAGAVRRYPADFLFLGDRVPGSGYGLGECCDTGGGCDRDFVCVGDGLPLAAPVPWHVAAPTADAEPAPAADPGPPAALLGGLA